MGDNPLLQFVDSPGFWVVTSHALVSEVDRDQERFSSALGGTFMPSLADESLAMFRQMMLNMDHPDHSRLRRILQPIFTPKSVGRLRESIEANAHEIVAEIGADEFDLVTAVSAEMPLRVLADLFGMPREDRHLIFEWSNALLGADNPGGAQHAEDSMSALAGMMAYGQAMADERRTHPRDDIVSRIVTRRGRRRPAQRHGIPDVLAVARRRRERDDEERSVRLRRRVARTRAVAWLASHMEHARPRGGGVAPLRLPCAPVPPDRHARRRAGRSGRASRRQGRDLVRRRESRPAVFPEPHGLDLRRDPNPHVAFGIGPHFCLGAHLARLEMTEMLRVLLERAPNLTIGEPTRIAINFINGIAHLPVRVGPRSAS